MGQIYFPDALNEFLYTNVPAYTGRTGERFVVNANDGIANEEDPNRRAFCAIKEEKDHYLATLTLGIDRSANARDEERNITADGRPERPPPGFRPSLGFGPPPHDRPGGSPPPLGPRGMPQVNLKDRLIALVPGLSSRRSK